MNLLSNRIGTGRSTEYPKYAVHNNINNVLHVILLWYFRKAGYLDFAVGLKETSLYQNGGKPILSQNSLYIALIYCQ